MEIINNNPFRILGIYSNSSARDIASHISKAKALATVNQNAVFSEDMRPALPEFTRNTESLNAAQTKINLPADKLKYALFWFCNVSSIDGIALGHLQTGNVDKALELFGKQPSYSSLINKSALILSQGDNLKEGIECIAKVIHDGRYRNAFVNTICGETFKIDEDQLSQLFIDALLSEISASTLLDIFQVINISSSDCDYLKAKTVGKPITAINEAIAAASSISRDDASANYDAGLRLMNDTKEPLKQLKELLSETDVQYQRTADNLAKAILQCGINYHNNTDDDDDIKIDKAFELQNHALSIAVGKLTKDRCKQNVDILVKKKKKLPPKIIKEDAQKIQNLLLIYALKPDEICFAKQLLIDAAPIIISIKTKLGKSHLAYIDISTSIVNAALHNLIEEVNSTDGLSNSQIKTVIKSAWEVTLMMDKFDVSEDFKENRYLPNKETLSSIVDDVLYRSEIPTAPQFDLRTEDEFYKDCKTSTDFKTYLAKYPSGKFVKQATDEYQKQLSQEDDNAFMKCASKSSYQSYITKFPQGKHTDQARKKIKEYEDQERKAIEEKRLAEEKEKRLFNNCSSKSDYENYLAQYPNGRYKSEAKNKIEEIKKRNKWITIIAIILSAILLVFLIWGLEGLKVLGIVVGILLLLVGRAL